MSEGHVFFIPNSKLIVECSIRKMKNDEEAGCLRKRWSGSTVVIIPDENVACNFVSGLYPIIELLPLCIRLR